MKRVVLALTLAVVGLFATDASARFFRNGGCNTGCKPAACETTCKKPCRKPYKIIDMEPCDPPCCVRWVKVKEPAICIRECRWVCPDNCTEDQGDVQ